jgi:hypothetical protein
MRRVAFSDGKDGGDFEGKDEVACILGLHVCKVFQGVMFPASKTKSPTLVLVVSRVVMAAIGHVAAAEVVRDSEDARYFLAKRQRASRETACSMVIEARI